MSKRTVSTGPAQVYRKIQQCGYSALQLDSPTWADLYILSKRTVYMNNQTNSEATIVSRGDYRIIRRNGAVVAFEPAKISAAMTKAFLAAANAYKVKGATASVVAASVPLDDGGDTSGTSPGAGTESGGDGDDDDGAGDGDGDGDGPRQPRSTSPIPGIRNSPVFPRLPRSKPSQVKPTSTPHRDALVALVLLTTVVLLTGVALATLGFPKLSASVIASLTGLPSLAARFIRPK
jgi:hypothetical protein